MPEDRPHVLWLSDRDIGALERSLKTRHGVLGLIGEMRSSHEVAAEADLLAHVAGIVQGHKHCTCGPLRERPPQ